MLDEELDEDLAVEDDEGLAVVEEEEVLTVDVEEDLTEDDEEDLATTEEDEGVETCPEQVALMALKTNPSQTRGPGIYRVGFQSISKCDLGRWDVHRKWSRSEQQWNRCRC